MFHKISFILVKARCWWGLDAALRIALWQSLCEAPLCEARVWEAPRASSTYHNLGVEFRVRLPHKDQPLYSEFGSADACNYIW